MVFVVERYLPGLSRSDLLRGLSRLEQVGKGAGDGSGVRYLGSTIVLQDEACYCRFEGPTEAAIAEANRRAGLHFDRIVPAVTVTSERRGSMNVFTTTQEIVEIRRSRLLGLIAAVAVLAAVVTWALSTYALGTSNRPTQSAVSATTSVRSPLTTKERRGVQAIFSLSGLAGGRQNTFTVPARAIDSYSGLAGGPSTRASRPVSGPAQAAVSSGDREAVIMSITPAALAAGALGGYALPSVYPGPTTAQILASMSPATRSWTKKVMSLTFAQLKGGAAGWP